MSGIYFQEIDLDWTDGSGSEGGEGFYGEIGRGVHGEYVPSHHQELQPFLQRRVSASDRKTHTSLGQSTRQNRSDLSPSLLGYGKNQIFLGFLLNYCMYVVRLSERLDFWGGFFYGETN